MLCILFNIIPSDNYLWSRPRRGLGAGPLEVMSVSGSITLDHLSVVTNTPKQIIYDQQLCIQQIPQDRFHVSCFAIYNLSQWSTSNIRSDPFIKYNCCFSPLLSTLPVPAGLELERYSIYQEKFQLKF